MFITADRAMRGLIVLVLLGLLAACTRPLAPGERALAHDIFGPNLDTGKVRVAVGLGLTPIPRPEPPPRPDGKIEPRPGICDRKAPDTGPREPPPAFVLYNRVHVMPEWYMADTMPGWPGRVMIPQALIMAHELVHVWQWQNRSLTGYRPVRAAFEGLSRRDPYFYRPGPEGGFLDYGYEQQAALIEDYMCYLVFDPDAPRRAELRRILSPYFTIGRLDRAAGR